MPIVNRRHGMVKIMTGDVSIGFLNLMPTEGNFSYAGLQAGVDALGADSLVPAESVPIMVRGKYLEAAAGDQTFPTGSITIMRDGPMHSATNRTIFDVLLKLGYSYTATTTDPGGVCHHVDLYFVEARDGAMSQIKFPNVRFTLDGAEASPANTHSLSWTCYPTDAAPIAVT